MVWTDDNGIRIWRRPESKFYGDEPLHAAEVYTSEALAKVQSHGFNAIWMRGRLYNLMQSTVLPELNSEDAAKRIASMREVIERGKRQGVGVYLFFNEPLGLREDHPLWQKHPELKGEPFRQPITNEVFYAMCTSSPLAMKFFRQAVDSLLEALPGLAGVILITATEVHSHCWSHTLRFPLNDGIDHNSSTEPACPRCKDREPSEIVLELLTTWRDAVRERAPKCNILAWSWSWSVWYQDPQAEIVSNLPEGVQLMIDWERGGKQNRNGQIIDIDEYSLSYPGPSERFLACQAAAPKGTPVHTKLQLGTTHEIATVPNLPLIYSLHAKLQGMTKHNVAGTMGCWNFGSCLTLNTYAIKLYMQDPQKYEDADVFAADLAREYLGVDDTQTICEAWQTFGEAFLMHYPFSTEFLYWSPVNDAPGHPLSLKYEAKRLGPSWEAHDYHDDAGTCVNPYTVPEVADRLGEVAAKWRLGLALFEQAIASAPAGTAEQQTRRAQELSCVRMIGLQMQSAANFFRFHRRRLELTAGANSPCTLPADEQLLQIMREEVALAESCLPLVDADDRLGFHQEDHFRMYGSELIRTKIQAMQQEIAAATGTAATT